MPESKRATVHQTAKKTNPVEQFKRFKDAARELGCDQSETALDRKLKKVATAGKPVIHKSDCAVHDAPAYKAGACTCGAEPRSKARR